MTDEENRDTSGEEKKETKEGQQRNSVQSNDPKDPSNKTEDIRQTMKSVLSAKPGYSADTFKNITPSGDTNQRIEKCQQIEKIVANELANQENNINGNREDRHEDGQSGSVDTPRPSTSRKRGRPRAENQSGQRNNKRVKTVDDMYRGSLRNLVRRNHRFNSDDSEE